MTTLQPKLDSTGASGTSGTRLWGVMAEFKTPGALLEAAGKVHKAGYRWWDCCTPFPVHGLDKVMGIKPTILPVIVFFAGLTGTILAFSLQTFTNSTDWNVWALVWVTGYPYLISGKPLLSLPAFIPVMFELTILLSALTATFAMYIMNGLPRLHHPLFKSDRFIKVTDDRFFIVIESRDPKFFRDRTISMLQSLGAESVEEVEE